MKACLLETLSIQEKKNILFKSEPLGGLKPSQMLVNMLAYCPSGKEQSIMFQYMFLQRLLVTPCGLCWGSRSLVTLIENQIFLIYKEMQSGAVAKSCTSMRKDFLICEEMHKYFHIYKEAISHI